MGRTIILTLSLVPSHSVNCARCEFQEFKPLLIWIREHTKAIPTSIERCPMIYRICLCLFKIWGTINFCPDTICCTLYLTTELSLASNSRLFRLILRCARITGMPGLATWFLLLLRIQTRIFQGKQCIRPSWPSKISCSPSPLLVILFHPRHSVQSWISECLFHSEMIHENLLANFFVTQYLCNGAK